MSKETETKPVVLKVTTDQRLLALGEMGDTRDDVVQKLLGETWHIPQLKDALNSATEKLEASKKTANFGLAAQAADMLKQALESFVKAVESR